jgi:hypothetical protein
MPWTAADAKRHSSGLTAHQAQVWARVANSALRACTSSGGSAAECEGRALRQAAAVAKRAPTKSVELKADGTLEILAIPFSGPIEGPEGKGVDTDGEFFSENTDLCVDWYPTHRPLLYEHGRDDDLQVTPIGKVDVGSLTKDEAGWWVRAQVDKSNRYWAAISRLLDEDRLYASSGAYGHLVKRTKDGEITRWPWVELSLTPTPANVFAMVAPADAKAHYKAAGITPPPTIDDDDTRSYADLLDRLTDDVGDFAALTSRLTEGRTKVGRPLSEARRKKLAGLMEVLQGATSEIEAILQETAPKPREESGEDTPDDGGEGAGEGKTEHEQKAEGDGGTNGAAAHAPPELASIFAKFREDEVFYAPVLSTPRSRR